MVLHGLEGAIRAHLSLSGDGARSDPHSAFPFAHSNLQPPLTAVVQNVKYCTESFHRRQQDESKHEFQLKIGHDISGEKYLETVGVVFDKIRLVLDGCNMDKQTLTPVVCK